MNGAWVQWFYSGRFETQNSAETFEGTELLVEKFDAISEVNGCTPANEFNYIKVYSANNYDFINCLEYNPVLICLPVVVP